ncbi:MAG: cell division protein FtsA [Bacteroidetes bacterium]|nr:cell division protein FtsA [Bacteroidota bacterium]MBM3424068.1 cell division protein FtsA [Bacteroidota bacterium]
MTDKSFAEETTAAPSKKRSKVVVGLDIGTTKIACFVGVKNEFGKIEIISMGKTESLGVLRGVVSNIEKTINSIVQSVALAQERVEGSLKINNVNVGIAGQHIKSVQTRGMYVRKNPQGEISQKDIDALIDDMYALVMSPGEEIVTVLPQEYIVDNEQGIKDPQGMAGIRLEANFHIITGHVSNVTNIRTCVERAGLSINEIILEPIASANAVLNEEEKEAGVVLVDIGGGTTDIAVFYDGLIRHTAVIPFGGNVVTEDIRNGCKIIPRYAEILKVKYGSALESESKGHEIVCIPGIHGNNSKEISLTTLAGIIQARMEEIIELVQVEIRNSGVEHKIIGGIVVTGGGAQLNHLPQLFEFKTGMSTRIGYPTVHLANTNKIEDIDCPVYSTGIGLVLKGFEHMEKGGAVDVVSNTSEVRNHTDVRKKGSFFAKVMSKETLKKLENFFTKDDD